MEKKPISRAGFDALIKELKDLQENQRPEILKTVQWARSLGDLSENADYSAAKEKQRQIDARIRFIENVIENAAVIDVDSLTGNRVVFGARVIAEDEDGNKMQCRILSDIESGKNGDANAKLADLKKYELPDEVRVFVEITCVAVRMGDVDKARNMIRKIM